MFFMNILELKALYDVVWSRNSASQSVLINPILDKLKKLDPEIETREQKRYDTTSKQLEIIKKQIDLVLETFLKEAE